MSLRSAQQQLTDANRSLERAWRDLRDVWRDEAGRTFERDHIAPIDPAVRHAITAMARMTELLEHARAECE